MNQKNTFVKTLLIIIALLTALNTYFSYTAARYSKGMANLLYSGAEFMNETSSSVFGFELFNTDSNPFNTGSDSNENRKNSSQWYIGSFKISYDNIITFEADGTVKNMNEGVPCYGTWESFTPDDIVVTMDDGRKWTVNKNGATSDYVRAYTDEGDYDLWRTYEY